MLKRFLCGVALLALASNAAAEFYIGAKTGTMLVDISGADDPVNTSLILGYEFGVVFGDVGLEAEFSRTTSDGEVGGEDLEVDTNGYYVTFLTPGALYLKARAGMVDSDVKIGSASESDNNSSLGVGVGISTGILRVELEFTTIDDDIEYLTLGLQF